MALAPQQFCVRWNSYHTNLQTVFPKLLSTENFADVTLACENRQLRCHKVVLSACSAYFERLLVQNPCKHPIIFMKDMRFSEMQSLVDFMYKGEVNVTQDDLPSLLKSAEALQIRGLCSSEAGGAGCGETEADAAPSAKSTQTSDGRDYTLATEALLAHAQLDCGAGAGVGATRASDRANGPAPKKRACGGGAERAASGAGAGGALTQPELKEEQVEEDGLFYGELEHDDIEFNEDDEPGKAGGSLGQPSVHPFIRVKPESKLFQTMNPQSKSDSDYLTRLSRMNAFEIQSEFAKYGFTTNLNAEESPKTSESKSKMDDNDFYKSWLEQNGELEVSLLRTSDKKTAQNDAIRFASEVELIPKSKTKSLLEKTLMKNEQKTAKTPEVPRKFGKRGRPPLFKDKYFEIGDSVLKADLDQFLEGKEISSSGLSRKDLERVMMGKFNPNRRYSNEAMWAALMDVKKGGSIYRAAQTHKVPRKSLRNWMKRCQIKSSFPMPQQLKQFVENNKRQKEIKYPDFQGTSADAAIPFNNGNTDYAPFEPEFDMGKHFLTFTSSNTVSSDEEMSLVVAETSSKDTKVGLIESANSETSAGDILNMSMRE